MTTTFAEQAASLITSTFKDGEASDGTPTAEEQAAAAADAKPATPAAEVEAEEGAESGDESDADEKGDEKPAAEQPKVDDKTKPADQAKAGKKTANERMGELTAARRTAERAADTERARADSLAAELATLKSGKAPLTAPQGDSKGGDVPPDPSTFDYGELDPKYIAALARHETRQALSAQKADDEKVRQADAAAAKQQEQATKQTTLVKAGVALFDDFDDVVMEGAKTGQWKLSQTLGELLLDSEFGPQIAYELAKDPDEAERVYKLSPAQQATFLGRQEAKFEAAKPSQALTRKTPQAQTPPKTPKGGSGSNKVSADSQDFAAVEAAWKAKAL